MMKTNYLWMALVSAGLTLSGCDDSANAESGANQGGDAGGATAGGDNGDDAGGNADNGDDGGGAGTTGGGGDDGGDNGDDGTGGDDGSFIIQPDNNSVNIECSVWDQDCGEGEKCMPWANDGGSSWNATKCTPLDPNPGQPGDECTVEGSGVSGVDSCDVSSMCWGSDPETNIGYCVEFCQGSQAAPSCADPEKSCSITNDGVMILCLDECDPLTQDCQSEDDACYIFDDGGVCVVDASRDEEGGYGSPCEYVNACDPGFGCFGADGVPGCQGSEGCCTPFCDHSADPETVCLEGAADGQQCIPYFNEGEAPPGYENLGICLIPGQ